jgi:hypothetical protein
MRQVASGVVLVIEAVAAAAPEMAEHEDPTA